MVTHRLLKRFYLFRNAEADDIDALEARSERRHYASSELIFREGDPADALYLVELGTIEIIRVSVDLTVLITVGSGGSFGELSFFDRGARPAAARAREASHLIKIPFTALAQTLEQRPRLAQVFYPNASAFLATRLRRTLLDLSFARELIGRHF
jgi:CRP-like cAMP-binding protein